MNKENKILVVGGTGFIGYHLLKKCLKYGLECTSISTKKPKKKRKLKKVNYIICDIGNLKKLKEQLKDNFNYVVNLGGHVDHTNKKKVYKSHYLGCKNLASIFLKRKIKTFVQIGSCMEYGNLKSPQKEKKYLKYKKLKSYYGQSKLLASLHLKKMFYLYKFPIVIFRLYQVYGPKQDLNRFLPVVISSCLKNKKFPCTEGSQLRDFIYIDDVVNAIVNSLNNKDIHGKDFNIGSGLPLEIKSITKLINKNIGSGKPLFGKIKMRKDEIKELFPNISKAKKKLAWRPKVKFAAGISKTINYYRNERY